MSLSSELGPSTQARAATAAVVGSYLCWGFFGLYFKAMQDVPAIEILAQRIVWSVLLLILIVLVLKKGHDVLAILRSPRKLSVFALSALMISINWGVYIYAVVSAHALEGSMGYFIMPLVAVALGRMFLGERFNRVQIIAISLACLGVFYQVFVYGQFPWIALTLALSFGTYGLLRKKAPADSMVGLFVETLLISPLALTALFYWSHQGTLYFSDATLDGQMLLALSGPITVLPLILFAYGARRLRYSTVGLLQYMNPTCQFFVAIYIFKEPFDPHILVTFSLIWAGLIVYSWNVYLQSRHKKAA